MPKKKKTGPKKGVVTLSKAEEVYVRQNAHALSLDQICKDLRKPKTTKKVIELYEACKEEVPEERFTPPSAGDLFVRDDKRQYTVMTHNASEAGDEARKAPEMPAGIAQHVHKIK